MPPPIPRNPAPDWWSRNWRWFVPLISLASIVGIGGCVALVFGLIKSSGAYVQAVERAKVDGALVEKLGPPVREGYFTTGQIHTNGASGNADLAIPIQGTREKATIYVKATKELGAWNFDALIVQIDRTGERIDLQRPNPSLKDNASGWSR